ncbi:MAG: S-layer homology domain-containing protein [Actinomycetota bacterium]
MSRSFGGLRATRWTASTTLLMSIGLLLVLGVAKPAVAQEVDPYQTDPLDLIALRDETRTYSTGTDIWEVWICDVPDGSVAVTSGQASAVFAGSITPYFEAISGGIYSPRFVAGGTVTATSQSGWPANPFLTQPECEQLVAARAGGAGVDGVMIVTDAAYTGGYATAGFACLIGEQCPAFYPGNYRLAVLGGGVAVPLGGRPAALRTVAHEIGHALFWPHSFGGLVNFENGIVYEYDNPMDVMSGGEGEVLDLGTVAINRYAAGWIGSEGVIFHRGGSLTYHVTVGSGIQLLILPTEQVGVYETIGARLRFGYDSGIPVEGVEVYHIDQSPSVCGFPAGQCFGPDRRTIQVPALAEPAGTGHVHQAGSTFSVRGVTITVGPSTGTGFTLIVTGDTVAERFVDDDGNIHEASIEAIADRGITRGCNPPLVDHFCPAQDVSRAEMAAFLITAIGETPAPTFEGLFSDVPAGAWYTPYVERLRQLGITSGNADGTYAPNRQVTRAEMAVFLARAFALPISAPGTTFSDVTSSDWYAAAVEAIRAAGITAGCSTNPPRYCPIQPVKRDQMATFLTRALHLIP